MKILANDTIVKASRHNSLCHAGLASCVDHGSVANGLQFLTGTREGDVVAFRCVNGYSLLGARQLQCNSEGSWGGLSWPLCLKGKKQGTGRKTRRKKERQFLQRMHLKKSWQCVE